MKPTRVSPNAERDNTNLSMVARSEQTTGGSGKEMSNLYQTAVNTAEPAIPSELPDRPWQKAAADFFKLKDQQYLLVIGYFS